MLISTSKKCAWAVLLAALAGVIAADLYMNQQLIETLTSNIWELVAPIVSNQYVSGIVSSFICIYLVYRYQLRKAKAVLRKDTRCEEVMAGLRFAIDTYHNLIADMPEPAYSYRHCANHPFSPEWNRRSAYAKPYCDDFQTNKKRYETVCDFMLAENNSILIDSMRATLFLNVNPEALSIINNIQNRTPTLKRRWEKAIACDADDYAVRAATVHDFMRDMGFLATYYESLLDYLGYGNKYQELVSKCILNRYGVEGFFSLPIQEQLNVTKRIKREMYCAYAIEWLHIDVRIASSGLLAIVAITTFMLTLYCGGIA